MDIYSRPLGDRSSSSARPWTIGSHHGAALPAPRERGPGIRTSTSGINSPGGGVTAGLAICRHDASVMDIVTTALGYAAWRGRSLLAAGIEGKR